MLLCYYIKLISDGCSHAKSVDYFLDSINSPQKYLGYLCTSWNDFQTGKCDTKSTLHMGESIHLNPPRGKYYLSVSNFHSPFKGNTRIAFCASTGSVNSALHIFVCSALLVAVNAHMDASSFMCMAPAADR